MSEKIELLTDLIPVPSWWEDSILGDVASSLADTVTKGMGMTIAVLAGKVLGDDMIDQALSDLGVALMNIYNAAAEAKEGVQGLLADVLSEIFLVWFGVLSPKDRAWVLNKLGLQTDDLLSGAAHFFLRRAIKTNIKKLLMKRVVASIDSVLLDLINVGKALQEHGFSKANRAVLKKILTSSVEKEGTKMIVTKAARFTLTAAQTSATLQAFAAKSLLGVGDLNEKYRNTAKLLKCIPPVGEGSKTIVYDDWKYLFFLVQQPMTRILAYTEIMLSSRTKAFSLV